VAGRGDVPGVDGSGLESGNEKVGWDTGAEKSWEILEKKKFLKKEIELCQRGAISPESEASSHQK
jgi:hypothetical protein